MTGDTSHRPVHLWVVLAIEVAALLSAFGISNATVARMTRADATASGDLWRAELVRIAVGVVVVGVLLAALFARRRWAAPVLAVLRVLAVLANAAFAAKGYGNWHVLAAVLAAAEAALLLSPAVRAWSRGPRPATS